MTIYTKVYGKVLVTLAGTGQKVWQKATEAHASVRAGRATYADPSEEGTPSAPISRTAKRRARVRQVRDARKAAQERAALANQSAQERIEARQAAKAESASGGLGRKSAKIIPSGGKQTKAETSASEGGSLVPDPAPKDEGPKASGSSASEGQAGLDHLDSWDKDQCIKWLDENTPGHDFDRRFAESTLRAAIRDALGEETA